MQVENQSQIQKAGTYVKKIVSLQERQKNVRTWNHSKTLAFVSNKLGNTIWSNLKISEKISSVARR